MAEHGRKGGGYEEKLGGTSLPKVLNEQHFDVDIFFSCTELSWFSRDHYTSSTIDVADTCPATEPFMKHCVREGDRQGERGSFRACKREHACAPTFGPETGNITTHCCGGAAINMRGRGRGGM